MSSAASRSDQTTDDGADSPLDAFHLPGLEERDVERWEVRQFGADGIELQFPVLHAGVITWVADRLKSHRAELLHSMPTERIVNAIGQAARRLADPTDPLRILAERSLPAVTGYSLQMVRLILDRMTRDWSKDALSRLILQEFPGRELDGFRRTGHNVQTRARGPVLCFHVCSGNVPGVAVTSIIRSLLVRSATIAKTAAGEPLLPVLFARALNEVDPAIGGALAVTHWSGGRSRVEGEALHAADLIVVYGGEDTIRSVRTRAPARTRIVEHGPRASVGLLGRNALETEPIARATAVRVAWAISMFDQQGCVSPHVIWIEGAATTASRFCRLLGEALDAVHAALPRGSLSAAEAAAIRDLRTRAEFRAIDGDDIELFEGEAVSWTVVRDNEPSFATTCLNRTITVKTVPRLDDVMELIAPFRGFIQSVALEGAGDRTADLVAGLVAAGATRITNFRQMPWPPPTWHHDGAGPLRELVTWVDLET